MPAKKKDSLLNSDREKYSLGGQAAKAIMKRINKLLKKHKGDDAVKSDIYYIKEKLSDIDNEISSFTKQEVDNSSSIREVVDELEGNKDDLVSALKQIDEEGVPLNYDETGFPTSERVEKLGRELRSVRDKYPKRRLTEAEKNILREELPKNLTTKNK